MIRLLLVDDHALFRHGLKGLLSNVPDMRVVAEAGGYVQATEVLSRSDVSVVVTDLSMPGRDGIELTSYIKAVNPVVRILVLTMYEVSDYATRALRAGASGYMTKGSTAEELVSAIRRIASGHTYVCPNVSEKLMQQVVHGEANTPPHATLSHREFRIFELLVQCRTTTAIARELSLSVKTVSTHKTRLLRKMGLQHQGELVRYAIEHELPGQ
jgi:two-component system, NarL family, invasion response regulator UvrY